MRRYQDTTLFFLCFVLTQSQIFVLCKTSFLWRLYKQAWRISTFILGYSKEEVTVDEPVFYLHCFQSEDIGTWMFHGQTVSKTHSRKKIKSSFHLHKDHHHCPVNLDEFSGDLLFPLKKKKRGKRLLFHEHIFPQWDKMQILEILCER